MIEIAKVIKPGLNLHSRAGAHAPIKTALTFGDRVEVLGRKNVDGYIWLRVKLIATATHERVGLEGWVYSAGVEYIAAKRQAPHDAAWLWMAAPVIVAVIALIAYYLGG